ncbi:MAG: putative metal chaperone YciC [Verrucomicrobiota bacterium]|nr:GTP-binding protein [Opitutaceae bacterium]
MNVSRANQNDGEIGAVGISAPGELDENRLNAWVAELLVTKGEDILSTRGVLAVHGSERPLILQGLNQHLETRFERAR